MYQCLVGPCYLYYMEAQNTVRTYGLNQVFRFVKGIWLHRNSRIIFFSRKRPILLHMCATCSELPSYISTMVGQIIVCSG